METTLHRQLKQQFAENNAQTEVRLGRYRIDACRGDELIEVQHGSLSAIRDKIQNLLSDGYSLRVVKPLIARRVLVKLNKKGGKEISRRYSPKRCTILDVFHELIYFTRTFPHPGLVLEVPLVEVEEWRYPGHGKRRRWRKSDFQIQDQYLVSIESTHEFRTARDIAGLLPDSMPKTFHTGHIAKGLGIDRSTAQRIAYCLRHFGSIRQVGKQGNAILYEIPPRGRVVKKRRTIKKRRAVRKAPESLPATGANSSKKSSKKTVVKKTRPKKKTATKKRSAKKKVQQKTTTKKKRSVNKKRPRKRKVAS